MKIKDLFKEDGLLSGKRVLALSMVFTFLCGITIGVNASNYSWKSSGNVSYSSNGSTVVAFNKDDLDYLDGRIDTIEQNVDQYKTLVSEKINSWQIPNDKKISSTSSFDQINTALEYIKSIPNEGEVLTSSGNPVYVAENGSVTTDVSQAKKDANGNANPLTISAANADNLSAGSAAWVNGSLVVGTGADNKSYYAIGENKYTNQINPNIVNYIYYRTANHTKLSSWADIYNYYIKQSPYSISATKSGDLTGNSGNGNNVSDSRSMTILKVKKGDTVSYSVSFANSVISNDANIYMSFNNGAEQTISLNRSGTYTFTQDYDSVKVRVYAAISNWGDYTRKYGYAHISATYNGSYDNFIK